LMVTINYRMKLDHMKGHKQARQQRYVRVCIEFLEMEQMNRKITYLTIVDL